MYRIASFIVCILFTLPVFASGEEMTRSQYIETWKEEAVYQMVKHGVPASITLAQGILESRDGNSRLAKEGNNHFGIKCHSDWSGDRIYEDDDEQNECFRKYRNARESFDDHSDFLKKPRYAPLFELESTDYKAWARGLKDCGYATSSVYAQSLIRIIEENNLQQYDEQGVYYAKNDETPSRAKAHLPQSQSKKSRKQHTDPSVEERPVITLAGSHEIMVSDNRIKYVVAREGDTRQSIAQEIDLNVFILDRFNDFEKNMLLKPGDRVYLQPKRTKTSVTEYIAVEGDTWFSISQQLGIKVKQLCKLNNTSRDKPIEPGTHVVLEKK